MRGPRDDWFTDDGAAALLGRRRTTVDRDSNRVGMRLDGADAGAGRATTSCPARGSCRGAVQVPPSGQPVLFLADHPVTGGYPVIAVVVAADVAAGRAGPSRAARSASDPHVETP